MLNRVAQFPPSNYVYGLMNLHVPGYTGYFDGQVAITSYLSANPSFGGNTKATDLNLALQRIVRDKPEKHLTANPDFFRVFTGQGSRDNFIAAMSIIAKYADEFKKVPTLAKYFKETDYLQAMVNDACFGLDCIGFVGTYLVEAEIQPSYVGRRPLDFANEFTPVKSLDEIKDLACVMLTNGQHIQMIDTVTERAAGYIKVDLCQCSSGGPQINSGVTIRSGGGDYLPVQEFRSAVATNQYEAEHQADNAERKEKGLAARYYESFLRAKLTKPKTQFGYMGGAIFHIFADGDPKNPVGGYVYVGVPPNGLTVGTPPTQ
jgi:hypothetical protein